MSEETSRFKIPYPSRNVRNWFDLFATMIGQVDTHIFGNLEMASFVVINSPIVSFTNAGGGIYELTVSEAIKVASRTLGSVTKVYTPNSGVDPLQMSSSGFIIAALPRGDTSGTSVEMEFMVNVPVDTGYQVLGYFDYDDEVIYWWNGSKLDIDVSSILGQQFAMFAGFGSGPGAGSNSAVITVDGASSSAIVLGAMVNEDDSGGSLGGILSAAVTAAGQVTVTTANNGTNGDSSIAVLVVNV